MKVVSQASPRAALGFRAHSGWGVAVAVGGPLRTPTVLLRKEIALIDPEMRGAKQPYHAALEMKLADAEEFIAKCARRACELAETAVARAIAEAKAGGYEVRASGILLGSGRIATSLPQILASHPMVHTAEGEFFRDALKSAASHHGLKVRGTREKEVWAVAEASLHLSQKELLAYLQQQGKVVGPPWRQDEKLALLAGWLALAG